MRLREYVLALLIFFSTAIYAQQPYYWQIDKSKGLPSNTVYNILQDKEGFMWIAHNEGISRFDGSSFKHYSSSLQTSKAGSHIQQDRFGRIWYNNFDGYIYYVEQDTLLPLSMRQPFGFTRFGVTRDFLYVLLLDGIDIYRLSDLQRFKTVNINNKGITGCIVKGNKFIVHAKKEYVFENAILIDSSETMPNGPRFSYYQPYAVNKESVFYLERTNQDGKFYEVNNGKTIAHALPDKLFYQNLCFAGDYLWACTPNGVKCLPYNNKVNPSSELWFPKNNISSVFCDRDGNYWFTTLSDGLLLVTDLNTKLLPMPNHRPLKLTPTQNGFLLGTRNGDIFDFDDHLNAKLKFSEGRHEVFQLMFDADKGYTFFTTIGFSCIDKNGNTLLSSRASVKDIVKLDDTYYALGSSGNLGMIKMGNKPSIWDSLYNLYAFNGDMGNEAIFLAHTVRCKSVAYLANTREIYYATNLGVFRVSNQSLAYVYVQGKPLYASKLVSTPSKLFLLTGNGTTGFLGANDEFVPLNVPESIKDIRICNGMLFLIGERQLYILSLSDDENRIIPLEYVIQGQEINDILYKNGNLIIASNEGLVVTRIKPQALSRKRAPFKLISAKLGGKEVDIHSKTIVPYNDNLLEINYSLLNFNPGLEGKFYYSINGNNWLEVLSNSRRIELPSLSPGEYIIQFKQSNYEQEPIHLRFQIKPPFFQQPWFIFTMLALVGAMAFGFYKLRVIQITEANKLEMEKVELENSLGNSMLKAIKSQMNPHFFFNALNTIQSFILNNDKQLAAAYLHKFSRLTRMILEMSEKEMVGLDVEISALRLYLELEKSRFTSGEFDYTISIDPNLEVELIQIPSLMIQPYVENAIKHGLMHKQGFKKLLLEFNRYDDGLNVIVDDNGIGREASGKINAGKKERWNSFSTAATEKRLEILNKGSVNPIGVKYVDKVDELGTPLGTRIVISIPIT